MCLCPQNLVNPRYSPTRVCLSPGLTSRLLREAIEHKLQQMQRKELNQMAVQKSLGNAPTRALAGSKTASQLFFLDDLNCASADSFGIQSPLELLRQILSQGRICCDCRVAPRVPWGRTRRSYRNTKLNVFLKLNFVVVSQE